MNKIYLSINIISWENAITTKYHDNEHDWYHFFMLYVKVEKSICNFYIVKFIISIELLLS
jgi:hypothetical protein